MLVVNVTWNTMLDCKKIQIKIHIYLISSSNHIELHSKCVDYAT